MQRPPYFDWRLDRWKIGLAFLLWLGLLFSAPAQPSPPVPQGASPVARPGQRPAVGDSNQSGLAPSRATSLAASVPTPTLPQATSATAASTEAEEGSLPIQVESEPGMSASTGSLTLAIAEPGEMPLANSTPLFFGQASSNGIVEVLIEGQRYTVLADGDGYWQFAPVGPLPLGMTWVQAREVAVDGYALSGDISRMALVGVAAQPVPPPDILTPPPMDDLLYDSTPLLSGTGPVGGQLVLYARRTQTGAAPAMDNAQPLGEARIGDGGVWRWQMSEPLPNGTTAIWAEIVDDAGVTLTRSWPIRLDVAGDAQPSVPVETSGENGDTTR